MMSLLVNDFNNPFSNYEYKLEHCRDRPHRRINWIRQKGKVQPKALPPQKIILKLYENSIAYFVDIESIYKKLSRDPDPTSDRRAQHYQDLKLYYGMIFVDLIKNFENYYPEESQFFASIKKSATPLKNFLKRLQKLKFFNCFDIREDKDSEKYSITIKKIKGLSDEILRKLKEIKGNCPLHYILKVFMYQIDPDYHGLCKPLKDDQGIPYFLSTFSKENGEKNNQRIKNLVSNKRGLFPNRDLMMYEEVFVNNLGSANFENEVRLCENFSDERKLLCDKFKEGLCPLFLYVNHEDGKIYRLSVCRGNYLISGIY